VQRRLWGSTEERKCKHKQVCVAEVRLGCSGIGVELCCHVCVCVEKAYKAWEVVLIIS
jgi:hypothetical protein